MPEIVVIDASAVIDAATVGPRFDALTRLQERFATMAPALLAWELGNVVHGRKGAAFGATPARRSKALELMLAGIDLAPSDEASRQACGKLAARHALTFYDASYLELVQREEGSVLVTQDQALLAAAVRTVGRERATDLDGIPALLARVGD